MTAPRILIAGIGNIFLGDDAFGVEVAQRLLRRQMPPNVRVADFGIRGYDLAYALMSDYDAAILVDATARGGSPGTLYTIEPEMDRTAAQPAAGELEMHGMNPMRVLEFVRWMGGQPPRVLVVGCEPATLGDEADGAMGLSGQVEAAIDGAIVMIESLLRDLMECEKSPR